MALFDTRSETPQVIEHLMAGGQMLATQAPAPSSWSAEHRLMAAVLAVALVEVRDHYDNPKYERAVQEDLRWIFSDDTEWPCSFLPLCQMCGFSPEYVRRMVVLWTGGDRREERSPYPVHRRAA